MTVTRSGWRRGVIVTLTTMMCATAATAIAQWLSIPLPGTPRTADVLALDDGEVWEIRRNVLDRLMRSPTQRDRFESLYRDRALSDDILSGGRTGWPAILSGLKSLLETGKAPQIQMSPPVKMLEALKAMGIKTP